jgi:3',5'-cyclic AMP phosphodiesterase CpdA
MTVRCVALPLAALALALGCQSQPGQQIAADRPARDAGADGGVDGGAARLDAAGGDRSTPDAPRIDASRSDANRLDAAPLDAPADAKATDASPADGGGGRAFELLGAPMVFAPTPRAFGLSVVLRSGDPASLQLRVRDEELSAWAVQGPPLSPAVDLAQWTVDGLVPGRRYVYEVSVASDAAVVAGAALAADAGQSGSPDALAASPSLPVVLYTGSAATAPTPGTPFTFALIADSHIEPRDPVPPGESVIDDFYGTMESTLLTVTAEVGASKPDFVINLGDMLDYHLFGFNAPPPDAGWARLGYLNYRRLLGDTVGHAAHFPVIGNWDGESGCNTPDEIARSMSQRLLYAPGPGPDTYPEGGSANGDYYAFSWGDALFIVLNVMTYTPTCHLLGNGPGLADDWTLGAAQLAWLEQTLSQASSKWRFLFIHHTVGGAAGDPDDTAYGRGGGQAAYVGEQATIHAMMLRYGVQVFFYAHDHVFTDMVVDGVHYLLPGSAGAPWKFDSSQTGYTHYWPDSGYARVSVAPESAEVDLVSSDGDVLEGLTLPEAAPSK